MQEAIISFLKSNSGYVSGEEISRHLKISRAGIWKYIEGLRRDGYDIVAVPHLGYRLVSPPDKLFPHEIKANLGTQWMGKNIVYYDVIDSTMNAAFQSGVDGHPEGTVVIAEGQGKGKGRLGRSWVSPKGKGIYMSIIFRPSMASTDVAQLTLMSAVALCETVQKMTGLSAAIKWPNDILIGNKKLAGILTELHAEVDRVRFCIVGIGINVNTPLNLLPPHATSLKIETKQNLSRALLVQEILRSLEEWYGRLKKEGFTVIVKRWKELSDTLGRRVRIVDAYGDVEGQAVDLDPSGGLIIRSDNGITVRRMSGDVVLVR